MTETRSGRYSRLITISRYAGATMPAWASPGNASSVPRDDVSLVRAVQANRAIDDRLQDRRQIERSSADGPWRTWPTAASADHSAVCRSRPTLESQPAAQPLAVAGDPPNGFCIGLLGVFPQPDPVGRDRVAEALQAEPIGRFRLHPILDSRIGPLADEVVPPAAAAELSPAAMFVTAPTPA